MNFMAVVVEVAIAVVATARNTTEEALADMPEERWQW
jgi:hypothetical protein